jgi:glutamate-1-semialdehyde aminotransferase
MTLENGIVGSLGDLKLNLTFNRVGSMLTLFFTESEVFDFETAKTSDTVKFAVISIRCSKTAFICRRRSLILRVTFPSSEFAFLF